MPLSSKFLTESAGEKIVKHDSKDIDKSTIAYYFMGHSVDMSNSLSRVQE